VKTDYQNIDRMFRENFTEHRLHPSRDHWQEVFWKVRIRSFFSFGFTRFNFIYSILIVSTFFLSLFAFMKSSNLHHNNIIEHRGTDTLTVKTVYIYDTVINYVSMDESARNAVADTAGIIRRYLEINELRPTPAPITLNTENPDPENTTTERAKDMRVLHHTIQKRDTFIKYIEKPVQPVNDSNPIKRLRNSK